MAPVPAPAKTVPFDVTSSPSLRIYAPRFDMWDGQLDFRGVGYRTVGLRVPAQTHLDVTFRDSAGRCLRADAVSVYLPSVRSRGGPDMAKYRLHVHSLPAGTSRIEIQVHEGAHQSS